MTILEGIQEKIRAGQFEFSQHAVDQSIVRHIGVQELCEAIASGEIIKTILMTNMVQAVLSWASHRPLGPYIVSAAIHRGP
jgi:hypothetical protein